MSAVREAPPRLLTAEDVLDRRGSGRWELVRGEVRERMPAGGRHGQIADNVSFALGVHVRAGKLGSLFAAETGFLIARDPDTVRGADVAFVTAARAPHPIPDGWMTVVPDLVVEVVSPDDRKGEVDEKIREWLAAGVKLLWVVHPKRRQLEVYRQGRGVVLLGEHASLDGEGVLPGFILPVSEVFA